LVRNDLISALTQVYLMRFLFFLNSYEHVITGVRTADPPIETLGGILADDMGLGKTLTVLSTILRTAKMSKSYAEENNEAIAASKYGRNDTHNIFSRATLVIVPSSRT
jgi:SNF2 family DNA or RNA helicase